MKTLQKLFAATVCLSICVAALASNPVGVWKGKVSFDMSKMGPPKTPQSAKQMAMVKQKMSKLVLTITLKKDHTFIATDSETKKSHGGSWALTGNTVSLKSTDNHGRSEVFSLSKDGRVMSLKQGPVSVTLKRS